MDINFISTIATITVTLIGFISALFIFWYETHKTNSKKNPDILKTNIILFSAIIILSIMILTLIACSVYYPENEVVVSISFNLFFTLIIFSLIYFVILIRSIWSVFD